MRILLIEDEKKTAAYLAKGLGEAGFQVTTASDGESGLDLALATDVRSFHHRHNATEARRLVDRSNA